MPELDFSPFTPLTEADWRARIERELKGRPLEGLRWEVEPGIALEPFSTAEGDASRLWTQSGGANTEVVQYLAAPDADAARAALADGAEALLIQNSARLPDDWPTQTRTYFAPDFADRLRRGPAQQDQDLSAASPQVDGLTLHEAGATRVETLAWIAAQASEALHAETREGTQDGPPMEVFVGLGHEFVPEVAFLRALRVVLTHVAKAYEQPDASFHVVAVTSRYHQTAFAAHTNLLRNTLAAAAALIGGADALCVRPHDHLCGGSPQGQRLARMTHLLLRDEAHLHRVADAAGGAFTVETLTRQLAEAAWQRFREIEAAGGAFEAAKVLDLPGAVARQHQQRQEAVLSGKHRIVGLTRSPNPTDQCDVVPDESAGPLAPRRLATPLEQLRLEASQLKMRVALLAFGDPAQRSARAGFSREFLATAGLYATEAHAMAELTQAPDLVILCAGDEDYGQEGSRRIHALHEKWPDVQVWVAGKPPSEADLRAAGATFFLSARAPLYDHLREALAHLTARA